MPSVLEIRHKYRSAAIYLKPVVIDQRLTHLDLIDNVIPPVFQLPEAQGTPEEIPF